MPTITVVHSLFREGDRAVKTPVPSERFTCLRLVQPYQVTKATFEFSYPAAAPCSAEFFLCPRSARILEGEYTQIGCGVAHGFRNGRELSSEPLSRLGVGHSVAVAGRSSGGELSLAGSNSGSGSGSADGISDGPAQLRITRSSCLANSSFATNGVANSLSAAPDASRPFVKARCAYSLH